MKGRLFFFILVVVTVVDVVIPYALLAQTRSFVGSFLFWSVVTVVVIAGAGLYTRRWREQ